MLDHLEIKTPDLARTLHFYGTLLAPIGYRLIVDSAAKGFGDGNRLDFFLVEGDASENVHFAFTAPDRPAVDAIYAIGRDAGFELDRAPALAPHIHPDYYAGYLRDPDGRLVEFVCHAPV
ncbi:hypothetical protein CA223_01410 [Sphingomonas koreensis]|uniref:VOC domain-containing protein n=1 Tax=Sphingomonas koreensis TaxID=93064 RepID=A0A1L6JG08_9SPHN|nr:VOC family protein [Sphingomonas koreensis]APR54410.1 hypothetical protein BRX40_20080 [Sphingomonas koreensis]MDC7809442.1 VOC family protein [Sphingomonas koreensis]PJI89960.1 catechol 2,3-dioxygenase-like lactoylglutathione lyase family enzyme [Sphingomonas koreensis]RSU20618.1 hypothetical protein CA224_11230 [Sphingomonas koreensis]RSU28686.1 hypothetical protein CA225_08215 [Sphingomonas koreensis]